MLAPLAIMLILSGASVQIAGAAGTADMQVAITATPALPGTAFANSDTTANAVTYTISVTNAGQAAAQDVCSPTRCPPR